MSKLTPVGPAHTSLAQSTPTTGQMLAFSDLDEAVPTGPRILDNLNPLHGVKTRLNVSVGEIEITVGELMAARENQVVRLDKGIEQTVDLLLDGKVVARGQLVAVDEHFAVRITELPLSLKV